MQPVVYQLYSAATATGASGNLQIARDGRLKGIVGLAAATNSGAGSGIVAWAITLNETVSTTLAITNNPPREIVLAGIALGLTGGSTASGTAVLPNIPMDIPLRAGDSINCTMQLVGGVGVTATHVRFLLYVAES